VVSVQVPLNTMSRSVVNGPGLFLILYQVLGCICPGLYRRVQDCFLYCTRSLGVFVQVCTKGSRAVGACEYNVQVYCK